MKPNLTLIIALSAVLAPLPSLAQDPLKKDPPKKEEPKRDQRALDYEKAIKDLPKSDGAWTIYTRKKDLLLELPEDKFGKLFFVEPTFNTGVSTDVQQGLPVTMVTTGAYGALDMFKFEKHGDERVWLVRPNTKFRWDKDHWLATAIDRSFPQAYLSDFRIEQYDPEKKRYLINIGALFSGDLFKVNEGIGRAMGMQCIPDREKTGVDKVSGSPSQSSVRMDLYYNCQKGGGGNPLMALLGLGASSNNLEDDRSLNLKITYSVFYRHETDYKPRLADPRVGFFTEDFSDFSRYLKRDRNTRFIDRWDLRKKDPKAAVSEPVKPIVWTIDTSVPKEWREAAKRGILEWNRAFDQIGYKNAVQVVDAPEKDPNYDHADGSRNVYRWSVTNGMDGAIALMRTDPFTGEILNAAINFDATFVIQPLWELDNQVTLGAGRALAMQAAEPNAYTQHVGRNLVDLVAEGQSVTQPLENEALGKSGWNHVGCTYAHDKAMGLQRTLALLVSPAAKKKAIEEFITDVTAHECGHTMGLRHNFVGSTFLTTAQLGDEATVRENGISASVMDYTDLNPMAIIKGHSAYYNTTIGVYDKWAIKYGYTDVPGASTPQGETHVLSQIASQSGAPGLEFMTDEDADAYDPRVVRFDGAKDPINFQAAMVAVDKRMRQTAIATMPQPGQSYAERNRLVISSINATFRDISLVTRFIGGVNGYRAFKGDAGDRPNLTPVPAADQRQAMKLITEEGLSVKSFELPDSVLTSLVGDFATGTAARNIAPIRGLISGRQAMLLGQILSADRLDRIAENEFKAKANAYTINEHYAAIVGAVASELRAGADVSPVRRDLQNTLVDILLGQAASSGLQDDARNSADESLRYIARLCQGYAKLKTSPSTRTHVNSLNSRIERFLNRGRVEGISMSGGSGGPSLAELLGGLGIVKK